MSCSQLSFLISGYLSRYAIITSHIQSTRDRLVESDPFTFVVAIDHVFITLSVLLHTS